MDSTLITEIANKNSKIKHLYCSTFKNYEKNEFKYAKIVSKKINVPLTKGKSENPRNKVNKGMPKASASKQVNPKDFPTYKKDTKSAGSFRAATTAAKKAGKKTFTWEGRKYSTKEK